MWLLSLLTVCSFAGFDFTKVSFNFVGKQVTNWFDIIDHLTSGLLLPLAGLAVAIFVGWQLPKAISQDELASRGWAFALWYFCIRWVTPVAVTLVFLNLTGVM